MAELIDLHHRLGPQSRGVLIRDAAGAVLAGLWFIDYGSGTLHNQYNGATEAGLTAGASSYGIALALEGALSDGLPAVFVRAQHEGGRVGREPAIFCASRPGLGPGWRHSSTSKCHLTG